MSLHNIENVPEYKLAYAYPREDQSRNKKSSANPLDIEVAAARELFYSIETLDEVLNLTLSLNSRLLSRR